MDRKEIALKLSQMPSAGDKPRTVVITQGADDVIVAKGYTFTFHTHTLCLKHLTLFDHVFFGTRVVFLCYRIACR